MRLWPFKLHVSRVSHGEVDPKLALGELGQARSAYGDVGLPEYNAKLAGVEGIRTYDKMRRGDAQVRATLRLVKTPIISAQWYVQPASHEPIDREVAQFVEWNLHNMHRTFISFLWEALSCLDFGHYLFETVFELGIWRPKATDYAARPRERPVIKWSKFGPRHPLTIDEWKFDDEGELLGIFQQKQLTSGRMDRPFIPADRLLVFTIDEEAGDPRGISILRSAYKHWYFKENLYKVDAIHKERAIGIPIVTLPPGATKADKDLADELGRNLRTNEKANITLPQGWKVEFAKTDPSGANALESAEHHDTQIAKNVLAPFMNLGTSETGTRAVGSSQLDIFVKSLRYMADLIRMQINQYAIPRLVDYNYDVRAYPELRVRRIGENADWRALSVAVRNFTEPGILTPDAELEDWLRDQMDFPRASPEVMARPTEDRVRKPAPPSNKPSGERDASRTGRPRDG